MAKLHQIQLQYHPGEDRGLLRLRTAEGDEFRFWLTRRFIALLWPLLVRSLERSAAVRAQADPEARSTVLSFEHESALSRSDFATPFADGTRMPLGETPLLLVRARLRETEAGVVLGLEPQEGPGIDLALDATLLHSLARLVREVAERAAWGLALELGAPAAPPAGRRVN